MAEFIILLWAVGPPWLILLWYADRLKSAPDRRVLFVLFVAGAIAGLCAAGIEWGFTWGAVQIPGWQGFQRTLGGQMLRQFGMVAPIEELCKLAAVVFALRWVWLKTGKMPAQPATVLAAALAVAFGFAAQENLVMLLMGRATVIDRILTLPGHGIFAAPWGLALGFAVCRLAKQLRYSVDLVWKGWVVAVICHGVANSMAILSTQRGMGAVVFLFFPWMLYLGWVTEGLMARSQGEPLPGRGQAETLPDRLKQLGFGFAALWLCGLALMNLRILGNSVIDPWRYAGLLPSDAGLNYFLVRQFFRVVILGVAGWWVWRSQIVLR